MTNRAAGALWSHAPNVKVTLSTLWVFAMFNYLYADVMTLMDPGRSGAIQMTPGFLLGAAVLMETAIAMVLLSRVLKHRVNRWANIITGMLHTAAVLASLLVGAPALYYLFFATIEIACTLFIVWFAWRWKEQDALVSARVPGEAING